MVIALRTDAPWRGILNPALALSVLFGCFLSPGSPTEAAPSPVGRGINEREIAREDKIVVTPDILLEHTRLGLPELGALPGVMWANSGRQLIFNLAQENPTTARSSADVEGAEEGVLPQSYSVASIDVKTGRTTVVGAGYRAVAATRGDTVAYISHGSGDREVVIARTNGEKLCSLRDSNLMTNAKGIQALGLSPEGTSLAIAVGYETAAPKAQSKATGAAVKVFDTEERTVSTKGVALWITDRSCRNPRRVMELSAAQIGRLAWLQQGEGIVAMVFTTVTTFPTAADKVLPRGDIVLIDGKVGTRRTLVTNIGGQPSGGSLLALNPAGDHVAFVYDQEGSAYPFRRQLAVAALADGRLRLVSKDRSRGTGWLDSKTLWIAQPSGHSLMSKAQALTLDGEQRELPGVPGNGVPSPDGRTIAWLESDLLGNSAISLASVRQVGASWKIDDRRTLWKRKSALERYARGKRSLFQCESTDGVRPVAILVLPLNAEPGRRYPLIVDIHGGPRNGLESSRLPYSAPSIINKSTLEHDMWAAKGYAVLAPDFRASGLYGDDKIPRDGSIYERDIEDIMCAVQAVVDRGIVDDSRMAVVGHSYGGAEVSWIVTHSQRFKAAISKEGSFNVMNAVSWGMFGQSNPLLTAIYGTPYEFPERYRRMSVMEAVGTATTPTMFVEHGGGKHPGDLYAWMFAAWQERGVSAQLRLYDEEKHVLRRDVDRRDLLYASLRWIDEHLNGVEPAATRSEETAPYARTLGHP